MEGLAFMASTMALVMPMAPMPFTNTAAAAIRVMMLKNASPWPLKKAVETVL